MKYDTEKLAASIRKAVAAAKEFENTDDGGTCNFDCAYLVVLRGCVKRKPTQSSKPPASS